MLGLVGRIIRSRVAEKTFNDYPQFGLGIKQLPFTEFVKTQIPALPPVGRPGFPPPKYRLDDTILLL
jgi:hypothetical protein